MVRQQGGELSQSACRCAPRLRGREPTPEVRRGLFCEGPPPVSLLTAAISPHSLYFSCAQGTLLDGTKRLCFNAAITFLVLLQGSKMIDEALAQFRARSQNLNRYRSFLRTSLT